MESQNSLVKKIVNSVDKSLEFSSCLLSDSDDSRFVLKVYKKGIPYVLKGVHRDSPLFLNMNHEKRVLHNARLRNLKRVNKMIDDYYNSCYNAVLKEFFEGSHLYRNLSKDLFNMLKKIVSNTHREGFSNLDLRSDNIIIDNSLNEIRLIDFETDCRLKKDSEERYKQGIDNDIKSLIKFI